MLFFASSGTLPLPLRSSASAAHGGGTSSAPSGQKSKEDDNPASTGSARPCRASLHPWLHSDAPLGLHSDSSLGRPQSTRRRPVGGLEDGRRRSRPVQERGRLRPGKGARMQQSAFRHGSGTPVFAPEGRRNVATGAAAARRSPPPRNPWKTWPPRIPPPQRRRLLRPGRGAAVFAPAGAPECSHGCSGGAAQPAAAEPVDADFRANLILSPPAP
ncbi:hypothetical protein RAS1_09670 [Phycisphaerae bacterium RAS1]|nr:hypothetical protein RAS1_09670 [Phycisphaerae bacterium RAS1]